MKNLFKLIPAGVLLPILTLAQTPSVNPIYGNVDFTSATTKGKGLFDLVTNWIVWILGALMGIAVLVFFWGLVQYIISAGDEEKRKSGRGYMVAGIIALFVMVSVWGLVYLLGSLVGVGQGTAPGGVFVPTPTNPSGTQVGT